MREFDKMDPLKVIKSHDESISYKVFYTRFDVENILQKTFTLLLNQLNES